MSRCDDRTSDLSDAFHVRQVRVPVAPEKNQSPIALEEDRLLTGNS